MKKIRKIIHIDMDSFFASVEILHNPDLKNKPMAVGGRPERRGVISTASYEARRFGVKSGISSFKAFKLCPNLILAEPDFKKYEFESRAIFEIFSRFTNIIEPLSLDEAFLDVSDNSYFGGSATLIASEIRRLIYKERKLTSSAGIAPNKFLAKIASDWKKPNNQFLIRPQDAESFIKKVPIEKIFGVGRVTAKKMHDLGIITCLDLQKYSILELERLFGSFGKDLFELCRGIDNREVCTEYERKSLSVEETFANDLKDIGECLDNISSVYDEFLHRFNKVKDQYLVRGIFIKLKFNDFKTTTLEKSSFKDLTIDSYIPLIEEAYKRGLKPVRLIGLGVKIKDKKFIKPDIQLMLPL